MKVRVLGSRPAPAGLLNVAWRAAFPSRSCERVERRQIPYWQEGGWMRTKDGFSGRYQTPQGGFPGFVEARGAHLDFYIHEPPPALRQDSHWACFQDRGQGWFRVHMGRQPADVSSGILTMERLLTHALRRG